MEEYGTLHRNAGTAGAAETEGGEGQPLISHKVKHSGLYNRCHSHMRTEITTEGGDLILLVCYIITGLLDSCATAVWSSFVSMQTGNTVYLGLGLSNPSGSTRWIKSGISIAMFSFGSFCFSRYHRKFSAKKRWVMVVSFVMQAIFIVVAATITVSTSKANEAGHELHWHVLLPLAMIAFQSSGQAVASRVLEYGSLTSVVLTSIYCDLFSDAKLFTRLSENNDRNRRVAAPIMLLLGALAGGFLSRSSIGIAGALWIAAAMKSVIAIAWLFWKAQPRDDD